MSGSLAETRVLAEEIVVMFLLVPSIQNTPSTAASGGRSGLTINLGLNVGGFGAKIPACDPIPPELEDELLDEAIGRAQIASPTIQVPSCTQPTNSSKQHGLSFPGQEILSPLQHIATPFVHKGIHPEPDEEATQLPFTHLVPS